MRTTTNKYLELVVEVPLSNGDATAVVEPMVNQFEFPNVRITWPGGWEEVVPLADVVRLYIDSQLEIN